MKALLENNNVVYLKAGELYITDKPIIIKTLLGSCISLVLYNQRKKIAAISHAQLPYEHFNDSCTSNCPVKCNLNVTNRLKFVTCSTRFMFEQFEAMGIKKKEIVVKLFGGANVLSARSQKIITVGERNIETIFRILEEYKLKLTSRDIGGCIGRTIYLQVESGSVYVRKHLKKFKE